MSTASSAVTVLAVAVVCFFGNWKSQADAADSPAPSAEERTSSHPASMLRTSGKSTLDLVLDAQRRLAQSKINHTYALAQYMTAIKDAHCRQGSLLAKHHVVIEVPGQGIHD